VLKKCLVIFKWWILLYVLMGFLLQFLTALEIKLFQELLDKVVVSNGINDVTQLIIIYGLLLVGSTILNYFIEFPQVYLSHSIVEKLKIMALSKVSRIDYRSYQNIGTGEMLKVIENGAAAGTNVIYSFYLRVFHELLPTIIFSLFFISFYNVRIMLVIAGGYIVIFFLTQVLLRFLYRIKTSLLESQESMSKYSIRGFMELVIFRINKVYDYEIKRLNDTASDIIKKSSQIRMIHESFFGIFALLVNVIKVIVLIYGMKNILSGETSIGVLVALIMFIDKVYMPVAIFNVLYVDYKLNRVTYRRFEDFLSAPEDKNLELGKEITRIKGKIEFKNVNYDYGNTRLLNNVSFSVHQGMSVAIVGLSGSGKSTIIKLLLGLLKKRSGNIFVDGMDIDEIKLSSLYDHVSYISQESPIFDTTIRNNIVFDNSVLDERLYDILEKVELKEKVLSFSEKLDTMVGERGMKLSGGERQRLAFGRIIAQQRELVILDEPVSALDNMTEKSIMDRFLNINRGRTLIVITHRLNFIKDLDKILLVKDGEIIDEGDFEYLLENNTYFQELWNKDDSDET
jgi:ATP-binding cassette subfamily B protein